MTCYKNFFLWIREQTFEGRTRSQSSSKMFTGYHILQAFSICSHNCPDLYVVVPSWLTDNYKPVRSLAALTPPVCVHRSSFLMKARKLLRHGGHYSDRAVYRCAQGVLEAFSSRRHGRFCAWSAIVLVREQNIWYSVLFASCCWAVFGVPRCLQCSVASCFLVCLFGR